MSTQPSLTLPLADPLALIDATALFVIQVLIAQHPELLVEPDEQPWPTLRPLSHVYLLFTAVRELQFAIEVYRACLPEPVGLGDPDRDEPIPF